MLVVHKQVITNFDYFKLYLPEGAKILSIQLQDGQTSMWYLTDTDVSILKLRKFLLIGTGIPFGNDFNKENMQYIGTIQVYGGTFIAHCFEILEKEG